MVVTTFVLWSLGDIWLAFGQHVRKVLEHRRVFYFILALALILPTLFYYSLAKRMPRYVTGLAVLAAGLVLFAVGTIAYFVFGIDNSWSNWCFDLGQISLFSASVVFIWQGVKASRAREGNERAHN